MSLPNLANKINELCGKIQKLSKPAYLSGFISEVTSEANSDVQPILFTQVNNKHIRYDPSTGTATITKNGVYSVSINGQTNLIDDKSDRERGLNVPNDLRVTVLLTSPTFFESTAPIDYTLENFSGPQNIRTILSIPLVKTSTITITTKNDSGKPFTVNALLWNIVRVSDI